MERSEIRGGIDASWQSQITLRSIRATGWIEDPKLCGFSHSASVASVARIEQSEIRGTPFPTGLPLPDFAVLNPGYGWIEDPKLCGFSYSGRHRRPVAFPD
jgi:hypothetical protein